MLADVLRCFDEVAQLPSAEARATSVQVVRRVSRPWKRDKEFDDVVEAAKFDWCSRKGLAALTNCPAGGKDLLLEAVRRGAENKLSDFLWKARYELASAPDANEEWGWVRDHTFTVAIRLGLFRAVAETAWRDWTRRLVSTIVRHAPIEYGFLDVQAGDEALGGQLHGSTPVYDYPRQAVIDEYRWRTRGANEIYVRRTGWVTICGKAMAAKLGSIDRLRKSLHAIADEELDHVPNLTDVAEYPDGSVSIRILQNPHHMAPHGRARAGYVSNFQIFEAWLQRYFRERGLM